MPYANMMWRCKSILFLAIFFSLKLVAQSAAAEKVFVLYAASYDELYPGTMPKLFEPADYFSKDSLAFSRDPHTREVNIHMAVIHFKASKADTSFLDGKVIFDNEGRMTNRKDAASGESLALFYLRGHLPSRIISLSPQINYSDTSAYTYDRSGRLVGICVHSLYNKKDSVSCSRYLYDAKGKLVIAENEKYGPLKGTFAFEYDAQGRLVRRQFLDRKNGVVLCTDTLVYEFPDLDKKEVSVKHSLRIAGASSWVPVDEAVFASVNNRLQSYRLFPGEYERDHHGYKPGWSVSFAYDTAGKKIMQLETDSTGLQEYKTSWVHSAGNNPDTMRQVKYVTLDGTKEKTEEELIVAYYDAKGRAKSRSREVYVQSSSIRKSKWVLVQKEETQFTWKN